MRVEGCLAWQSRVVILLNAGRPLQHIRCTSHERAERSYSLQAAHHVLQVGSDHDIRLILNAGHLCL
jgi:hypothetical protein